MRRKHFSRVSKLLGMVLAVLAVICFCLPLAAIASPSGDDGGRPEENGRKPDGSDQGVPMGELFGDQWMVIRDVGVGGNGAPILVDWEWPDDLYVEGDLVINLGDLPTDYSATGGTCVQPFSFDPIPTDPEETQFTYHPYIDSYGAEHTVYLIPLDDECKIPDVYEETWGEAVREVESGRLNVARTGQEVFDAAYEEALSTLNQGSSIVLDPAGRLKMVGIVVEESVTDEVKTIDSPLENLALYQRMVLDGCLSATAEVSFTNEAALDSSLSNMICDDTEVDNDDLLRAASFLAGSADKTGAISVDMVVYLNTAMYINGIEALTKKNGSVQVTDYYDFGDFTYARGYFDSTVSADLLQPPASFDGDYPDLFHVENVAIMENVFSGDWDGASHFPGYPIVNFVRAADDALKIVNYIHNYELPELIDKNQ
mgnify:FL=1